MVSNGRCNGRSQLLRGTRVNGTGSVPFKETGSDAKNSRRAVKKRPPSFHGNDGVAHGPSAADAMLIAASRKFDLVRAKLEAVTALRRSTHLSPGAKSETCSKDQFGS
jgi:hypothetical protein